MRKANTDGSTFSPALATTSLSTEPASTAASWSGSPSRISMDCGRSASTSCRIIARSTIEASSTTMMSATIGSAGPRAKVLSRGRYPSKRCKVPAACGIRSRQMRNSDACANTARNCSLPFAIACASLCPALPVGAASAIVGCTGNSQACACRSNISNKRTTVAVLPVPGPPSNTALKVVVDSVERCTTRPQRCATIAGSKARFNSCAMPTL